MTSEIIILCIAAFAAGFIDAIVGGGEIDTNAGNLSNLTAISFSNTFRYYTIPSFFGASINPVQYNLKVKLNWKLYQTEFHFRPMCVG